MHRNNKLIFLVFVVLILAITYVYFKPKDITGAFGSYGKVCKDSDGVEFFVKGMTVQYYRGKVSDGPHWDKCIDDKKVKEWYCKGDSLGYKENICFIGCVQGRCLEKFNP